MAEILALVSARLIDGTGDPPSDGVTVTIADGRICNVGLGPPPPGARVLDLNGRTLMPGLVEAHVHMSDVPTRDDLQPYGLARAARDFLAGGFTTIRDVGAFGGSLFGLREAIALGLCVGPRLVLCGQIVAVTSAGSRRFGTMYQAGDGPDELRKAVRAQVAQGADFIKVMVTGALNVVHEDIEPAQMTRAELEAVVDESHRLGRLVAAHAEGVDGIRLAVDLGVNTLEHGELAWRAPDALTKMAERGIVLVPTLCLFPLIEARETLPRWMRDRAKALGESALRTVEAARAAGVAIAAGADVGPHGENARELVLLVKAGLSAAEAIVAATSTAARACGLADEIGTVAPGRIADLLVVDGDPLPDVGILTRPERRWLVLKAGRCVAGTAPLAEAYKERCQCP
jgi:imidazolonepropionase-like amidohydrolase